MKIANPATDSYKVFAGTAAKDAPALGFLAITQADLDDARLAELHLTSMLRRRERPKLRTVYNGMDWYMIQPEASVGNPPVWVPVSSLSSVGSGCR